MLLKVDLTFKSLNQIIFFFVCAKMKHFFFDIRIPVVGFLNHN